MQAKSKHKMMPFAKLNNLISNVSVDMKTFSVIPVLADSSKAIENYGNTVLERVKKGETVNIKEEHKNLTKIHEEQKAGLRDFYLSNLHGQVRELARIMFDFKEEKLKVLDDNKDVLADAFSNYAEDQIGLSLMDVLSAIHGKDAWKTSPDGKRYLNLHKTGSESQKQEMALAQKIFG